MPALGEGEAVGVGLLRGGLELRAQLAVADDEPGGDAQPDRRGRSNSTSTAGAKCAPNTSAVVVPARASPSTKSAAITPGVVDVGHARLLGQRAAVQPVEQRLAEAADHPHLREVHVRVDEAGQEHAAA